MVLQWRAYPKRRNALLSQPLNEAEYVAMGDVVKEAIFVRSILSFLVPNYGVRTIEMLEDNQGAM